MRKPFKHLTNLLRFSRGANIPIMGPLKAEWEVINQCNAKCKTCLHWRGKPDSKILNTQEGRNLIKQLSQSGLLNLCFTGGEPLLRKDLTELIVYAKKVGLSTSLMTNGLLITERRARELIDTKLDTLYVSLDGAEPRLNDEIRGLNGYYDLAISAIDNLKSMRRNAGPNIIIKTTVTSKNVRQLVPLANLAVTKGVEGFSFQLAQLLENAGFIFDKSLLLNKTSHRILINQMNILTREFKQVLTGSLEYYQTLSDFLKSPGAFNRYRPITGFSYVQIDSWGNIFTSPAKVNKIGNIKDNSFEEIWYGQTANAFRKEKEPKLESSYLFETVGSMSVFVNNMSMKRMLRMLRPIFDGDKYF
ncbi:radical SAM protein [candidate division KSB1 bacterium]|nr:radical SAM protein [candidate division KSB1 bacterium]NIR72173.1 radical SAM protein [candidate division KSB1 bacterium]NIS26638.1 radical SAM protein [candidate division KSB1 bacterium]NIT73406.1 radical SAM protein [candidate division KSB1 bacterium]NIU27254.1 radical SAM protein [candidate division KSB1 bacterium]